MSGPVSHTELLRRTIAVRKSRNKIVGDGIFADPAWEMLLDLYLAFLENRSVSVTSLCIAAAVPPTTALRYLQNLVKLQMVTRTRDGRDGRRVYVTLTKSARRKMADWADIGSAYSADHTPINRVSVTAS